jgi:ACDE family multidrug resistance protein
LLEEKFKIDGVIKGGFLAIPLLVMSITAYVTGIVIKKKLQLMRTFVITGMFLLAASYVMASFVKGVYALIAILVIGSLGTGMILPCLNSMIIGAVEKAERGMITSLYSGVRFIGVAVGPPVFTWLLDISRTVMFYSIAGLTALFGVVAIFFLKPKQQGKGEEGQDETETEAFQQVAEILGIRAESEQEKRRQEAIRTYGFDLNELMNRLLSGKKKKEKS